MSSAPKTISATSPAPPRRGMLVTLPPDAALRHDLFNRIEGLDDELSILEDRFSDHLGRIARLTEGVVVATLVSATIVLWVIGGLIARRLGDKADHYERALERSNDELQQFAYVASHDLPALAHGITGEMSVEETAPVSAAAD